MNKCRLFEALASWMNRLKCLASKFVGEWKIGKRRNWKNAVAKLLLSDSFNSCDEFGRATGMTPVASSPFFSLPPKCSRRLPSKWFSLLERLSTVCDLLSWNLNVCSVHRNTLLKMSILKMAFSEVMIRASLLCLHSLNRDWMTCFYTLEIVVAVPNVVCFGVTLNMLVKMCHWHFQSFYSCSLD